MKWGLGQSYENVDVLPKKLRAYLDLTKPASTIGVMATAFVISLFYFAYTGSVDQLGDQFSTVVFVVVTLGFAHGASQAMNMAEDAEMDRNTPHKKERPIPSGVVDEEEARTLAWLFLFFAIGRAYMVRDLFGIFVTVSAFMGIFYNLEPIRAKARIISIPWQAVSRGLLSFPLVWSAYGDPFRPVVLVMGVFMFFYVLGFQNTADLIDKETDEEYGIKTFVVVYGIKGVVTIAAGCMMMMVATMLVAIRYSWVPEEYILTLAVVPFCIMMLRHMALRPNFVSEKTGNHPSWIWFYFGLATSASTPLLIEITMA